MERDQGEEELRNTLERGEALKIRTIVIPADEAQPLRRDQIGAASLLDYQRIVGGNIEPLRLSDPLSSIYFNEEGKLLELPVNRRATLLLWAHNLSFRYVESLVGDALIVGPVDKVGHDSDVPAKLITIVSDLRKLIGCKSDDLRVSFTDSCANLV